MKVGSNSFCNTQQSFYSFCLDGMNTSWELQRLLTDSLWLESGQEFLRSYATSQSRFFFENHSMVLFHGNTEFDCMKWKIWIWLLIKHFLISSQDLSDQNQEKLKINSIPKLYVLLVMDVYFHSVRSLTMKWKEQSKIKTILMMNFYLEWDVTLVSSLRSWLKTSIKEATS